MAEQPASNATPLQDFLEKYVSDGFKRELDLEEAVWRTLPAFVTALGLLGTAAVFVFRQLVNDWSISNDWPASTALALTLAAMVRAAWELRFSVKRRPHRYPPDEVEMCRWAGQLRLDALKRETDPVKAERLALEQLRTKVLNEVAEAASCNQAVNAAKLKGRTEAARWIFWAAVLMMLTGVTETVSQAGLGENTNEQRARRTAAAPAPAAATAAGGTGSEVGGKGRHDTAQVPLTGAAPRVTSASTPAPDPAVVE